MIVICGKSLSRKVCGSAWRTFVSGVEKEPYWRAKFPDRIASFDEIPTVTEKFDSTKWPEEAEKWFKQFGHVVKTPMPFGKYNVHLFHFEDFGTVYNNDGLFPIRQSHHVIAQYREERKHLYDNCGLGASQGPEWYDLRHAVMKTMVLYVSHENKMAENVADDLIKIIRNNLNDKGEIDLIPWLQRWAFESIGVLALNRRLNTLSEPGNELADKMVEAAAVTDEMIAATTMDPANNYEELYKLLVEAQDYFYSVLRKYIDNIKRDIEMEPETAGSAQLMLQNQLCSEKNAIMLVMDLFQGSLPTITLTALMTLYHLACYNDVQARAREEAKLRMPNKDSKYFDTTGPKACISSVVNETLRLRPPIIGNGRVIQKDLVLGGYSVPAYTNVLLHFQVACRQEENYEDPLKFITERDHNRVELLFGGSSRACIGRRFATRQLLLLIAKILRNFELSYDGGEVRTINKLHNIPVEPLILRLKPIDE